MPSWNLAGSAPNASIHGDINEVPMAIWVPFKKSRRDILLAILGFPYMYRPDLGTPTLRNHEPFSISVVKLVYYF